MEGFAKEVAKRLPLAEAALRLLAFVCQEDFLNEIFERYRGRSYEKIISFALLVQLIVHVSSQWPSSEHHVPSGQSPHKPPHPSAPHSVSEQSGSQTVGSSGYSGPGFSAVSA